MTRTVALFMLVLSLAGCTRYSTRANGPFTPKAKTDPNAAIPAGPAATSSPLALGIDLHPQPLQPPDEGSLVPPRPPEPLALSGGYRIAPGVDVIPAGGIPNNGAAFPPLDRLRRNDVRPDQLPSPFAPKDNPTAKNPDPPAPSPGAKNLAEVKKLQAIAAERWAKTDTYEAVVTRRELAPNKQMCEDVVQYQYRKEPMAVYIRNIDETNAGREIIYNPSQYEDKIYSIIGKADGTILFRAGTKALPVTPDFPMVKDKTRYSIRDAGFGTPIKRVATWIDKAETGKIPAENLTFVGPVTRKEFPHPVAGVQLILRTGDDALMPKGGMRQWFFDTNLDSPSNGYPVLIIATEPTGKEVEYYLFEKMKLGVKFTDADFSPDRLGKKK